MWRRRLVRAKGRKSLELVSQLAGELKDCRKELRIAIGTAKRKAWDELLEGLIGDPWGRPYKAILGKIRPSSMDTCRRLSEESVEKILGELFPEDRGKNKYIKNRNDDSEQIPKITKD